MKYNVERHKRQSLRLKGYDYSKSGAYYVTICTQKRQCLLGTINDGKMVLNHAGEMVQKIWNDLSIKCPEMVIDEFIIMPNHVHGIIFIVGAPLVGAPSIESRMGDKDRAGTRPAPTSSLGDVVGIFKSISTHLYAINVNANNWPAFPGKLWQRNYYERIIRNDDELNRIREYILNNPQQWDYEDNNPLNFK
jgi:REP element-mobilizing transposase RayT